MIDKENNSRNGIITVEKNRLAFCLAWVEGHSNYKFLKKFKCEGAYEIMETMEKVFIVYDEMFCDELSIKLLYENKEIINEFVDENGNTISKGEVADWILKNYYNDRMFADYCKVGQGKIPKTAEQLYQYNEEYKKSVDEERYYLLHLIGMPVTKVANTFDISRQTVYGRIKSFEENRLQEFLQDGRIA